MKVLLLDDDPDMCALMRETFEDFKIQDTTICNSYQDVVDLGQKILDFHVVFLDVNLGLGQKNGVDVFNWITKLGYKNRVIFFTGHARSYPVLVDALNQRHVGLLEKPTTVSMIKKALYG